MIDLFGAYPRAGTLPAAHCETARLGAGLRAVAGLEAQELAILRADDVRLGAIVYPHVLLTSCSLREDRQPHLLAIDRDAVAEDRLVLPTAHHAPVFGGHLLGRDLQLLFERVLEIRLELGDPLAQRRLDVPARQSSPV